MVKHFQQQQALNSCISSRKRVSFVAESAEDRYSSAEVDDAGLPSIGGIVSDDRIERLLKVMQSMNVARIDSVERFTEISKLMSVERNQTFAGPKRIASDVNIRNHQKECRETVAKSTNIRQNEVNEVSPLEIAAEEIIHHHVRRIDGCKQALAPVASPSQGAVDSVKRLGEIARKRAVLRMSSVDGLTDDDGQSSSESTATDDTGSGTSSRRGSGDSLQQEPCRGYSAQRRHGRKDSLGTAVDFTRLIPTLVSDNEDFRQKEYQRTLSVQPLEQQNSTW